jgi:hypothetical protein
MGSSFFFHPANRRPVFLGLHKSTVDDLIAALVRQTNRHHQWFLVEAYELFEDFLEHAYAYVGLHHPEFWPLRDFGGIRWDEAKSKSYPWYLTQARSKKDLPSSIMRQFREVLPRVSLLEKANKLGLDLFVAVTLVAKMRHQIVHARGVILDKPKFIDDLLKELGYNGPARAQQAQFIDERLVVDGQTNAIHLQKIRVPAPDAPPGITGSIDPFDLVGLLSSYAVLVLDDLRAMAASATSDAGSSVS